jgi:arylsulfatase A-like enzyme
MPDFRPCVAFVVVGATLLAGSNSSVNAQTESPKPNILLIVADDMGYSDVGPFGGEIRTPSLDRLAQSGLVMTTFYVGPSCSPTRSMLMSGNDHHMVGMGTNAEGITPNQAGQPGYEGYLNDRVVSVASLLRDGGYHTYMAGKWHLGEEPEHDASKRGFERSYTMLQGGASHFDDEWMMCANYTPIYREDGKRVHVPRGFFSTEFYTNKLIEYIDEQQDDSPFFAYLAYTAVHDPLHVPDDWIDRYEGIYDIGYDAVREQRLERMVKLGIVPRGTQPGPWLQTVPKWSDLDPDQKGREARRMEIYAAMVENIDSHVGRLLEYLRKTGRYENTLIIFFSDNGANGFEMHMYPDTDEAWVDRNSDNRFSNWGRRGSRIAQGPGWAQVSSTPFRLFKGFIAEGGIRAPLIVSGPGVSGVEETSHAFTHVMDLAPTFLEIAGISYPTNYQGREVEPMRGRSMMPLLAGQRDRVRGDDEPIGFELLGWRAVRVGDWKVTWISEPFGVSNWQLFDLAADPGETRDLADQKPELVQRLVEQWETYAKEVGVVLPEGGFMMDE